MDLRDHFRSIWRRRWPIVGVSVVVAAVLYFLFASMPNVYQASAQLSVIPGTSSNGSGQSQSDTLFLAANYAQLGTTAPVVQSALKASHLGIDEKTAQSRLSVTASTTVGYITVKATGPTVAAATALAQGASDALSAAVTQQQTATLTNQLKTINADIAATTAALNAAPSGSPQAAALQSQLQAQQQLASTRQIQPLDQVNVVAPARGSTTPIAPQPKKYALLGFIGALIVDAELAVLLESLSDRFRTSHVEEEVRRFSGLPVLSRVPAGDREATTEAFRKIRTSITFVAGEEEIRSIAVIGTEPGVGKSFVSSNLARAMAESGRTVLIDGDMRRPTLHNLFRLPVSPGLSEALTTGQPGRSLHRVLEARNLYVVPAGDGVRDPSAVLTERLTRQVLRPLTSSDSAVKTIILDTPAEALFPDALSIAAQADISIVVIDARGSRRKAMERTLDELRGVGATPFGIIVNRAPAREAEAARYYSRAIEAPQGRLRRLLGRLTGRRAPSAASTARRPVRQPLTDRPVRRPAPAPDASPADPSTEAARQPAAVDQTPSSSPRRRKVATPRPKESTMTRNGADDVGEPSSGLTR